MFYILEIKHGSSVNTVAGSKISLVVLFIKLDSSFDLFETQSNFIHCFTLDYWLYKY